MESLIVYIAKVSIGLLVFMAIYALFLRKATFFRFNRCFLLIGFVVSLAMPFIKYTYEVVIPVQEYTYLPDIQVVEPVSEAQAQPVDVWSIVAAVYLGGMLLFFCRNIYIYAKLRKLIKGGEMTKCDGYKIVDNPTVGSPFTFFDYILLNAIKLSRTEKDLILKHERTHIEQKHWIDLLCSECMLLLQWFNPFAWLYVRLLKENHEYLADKAVIETGVSPAVYQAVLINQEFQGPVFSFSNSFSYPKSLKRLDMIKKTKSASWKRITALLIVPAFGLYLWVSAEPRYVMDVLPEINAEVQNEDTVPEIVSYTIETKGKNTTVAIYPKDSKSAATVNDSVKNKTVKLKIKEIRKDSTINGKVKEITIEETNKEGNNAEFLVRGIGRFSDKSALVFIDGEKATTEDLNKMDMKDIKSFSVLKGKSATDAYGDEGKDGAIIISTIQEEYVKGIMVFKAKEEENTPKTKDLKTIEALEPIMNQYLSDSISGNIGLEVVDSHTLIGKHSKDDNSVTFFIRGMKGFSAETPPLILIDGEKATLEDVNKKDVKNIKSFNVLKGKSATDAYGEDGKNGVLTIKTQESKKDK